MQGTSFIVFSLGLLLVFRKLLSFWNAVRSIENLPGYRVVFHKDTLVSMIARIPGISPGRNHYFEDKHSVFKKWDISATVSAFPETTISLAVSDADAIKHISSSRALFPKPMQQYEVLTFLFGNNIIGSDGNDWKKYRKICAPAFSDRNNRLIWDETVQIMNNLFKDVWKNKDTISLNHGLEITLPINLFVISVAGFGKRISWQDDVVIPPGHQMSFKDSLHIASSDIYLKLFLPDWALKFGSSRWRNVKTSFENLEAYMLQMIRDRREAVTVERHDLFSSLLDANNDDSNNTSRLTERELIANIFIFLIAGHETTANTLCFALGLLAIHEDEQEKLFQHVKKVLQNGRSPTYEDMPQLTHSMAVLNETLRLFPSVPHIPKVSAEDTFITAGNIHGEKRNVPVPKGTRIFIDTPGLHYNPRYWDEPEAFKPSRFLCSDWNRDVFVPFSVGARACLGRKAAETTGVALLTMLVLHYRIGIKVDPQYSAETLEQRKERVFKTRSALTLTPLRVPLTFSKRGF